MFPQGSRPAFNQTWIIMAMGVIALIILCVAVTISIRNRGNTGVERTTTGLTATQVFFPTATAISEQASQVNLAIQPTSPPPDPNPNSPAAGSPAAVNAQPFVAPARPSTYIIQKGEWLYCIARRYNLDVSQLLSINQMNVNSKPEPGTQIKIPASGEWNPALGARAIKAHPAQYVVVAGDTLAAIACKYGDVYPEAILAANGLSSEKDLTPGKTITIP